MKWLNTIGLFLCGLALGWLIGLSTTTIIQGIITSLLTIITSVITILFGLQNNENNNGNTIMNKFGLINIFPVSIFFVGIAISAPLGIYARTNEWFGVNPSEFREKWTSKGVDSTKIVNRLFELKYGNNDSNSIIDTGGAKLYSVSSDICNELKRASGNEFIVLLKNLNDSQFKEFLDSKPNDIEIEKFKLKLKCE